MRITCLTCMTIIAVSPLTLSRDRPPLGGLPEVFGEKILGMAPTMQAMASFLPKAISPISIQKVVGGVLETRVRAILRASPMVLAVGTSNDKIST